MTDSQEYILTTCRTSLQWSACLWDYNTGNSVQIYKNGGAAAQKTLSLLGNDYVMFAEDQKPLLSIWPVNSQDQIKNTRLILPEAARVAVVCPNNLYLAVGIGLKLYVWHIASGKLLTVQQKHFQAITCIKFASTGEYLAVAGQDGMLVVYNFEELVSLQNSYLPQNEMGVVEPKFKKMDHTLPINDMQIGSFGSKSRLVTVSSDLSCRIYALHTGELLLNLVFSNPLTSAALDSSCWSLFVGTSQGNINFINLKDPPRQVDHHVKPTSSSQFIGHKNKVTTLILNLTGDILASGSDDCSVIIWSVKSKQILRSLEHKGVITNILFVQDHVNFKQQSFMPHVHIKALERSLVSSQDDYVTSIIQDYDVSCPDFDEKTQVEDKNAADYNELVAINKQLYAKLKMFNDMLNGK